MEAYITAEEWFCEGTRCFSSTLHAMGQANS